MCEVTPREIKRRQIKEKLEALGKKDQELADLLHTFLDLDEEAQKAPSLPYIPLPYVPYIQPYSFYLWPWSHTVTSSVPVTITMDATATAPSGSYTIETTSTSL